MADDKIYVTQEGLEELKKELYTEEIIPVRNIIHSLKK